MRTKALVLVTIFSLLLVLSTLTGCGKNAYFGLRNKALEAAKEFAETEATVNMAHRSPGGSVCSSQNS